MSIAGSIADNDHKTCYCELSLVAECSTMSPPKDAAGLTGWPLNSTPLVHGEPGRGQ